MEATKKYKNQNRAKHYRIERAEEKKDTKNQHAYTQEAKPMLNY